MASPSIPTALSATQQGSDIRIVWGLPANLGGLPDPTYRIRYRARYAGGAWTEVAQASLSRSFTVPGFALNNVLIGIRAENPDGNSAYASYVLPPDHPRNVTVVEEVNQLRFMWDAPYSYRGSTLTGWRAEYRKVGDSVWTIRTPAIGFRRVRLRDLTEYAEYEFRVYAVSNVGESVSAPLGSVLRAVPIVKTGLPAVLLEEYS